MASGLKDLIASRAVLTYTVTSSHRQLFKFKLIEVKNSDALATFQVLSGQMWLLATISDRADREQFHIPESSTTFQTVLL